ncbi:MAG: electron transport complex subunit RsxC [Bacillota bacterium]
MERRTFPGGVHVPHFKELTEHKPIVRAREPKRIVLPLSQHTGAPCEPLVREGDQVKLGQKIGASEAFVSAPIHSSVSGTVASVQPFIHPALGRQVLSIIIDSDGQDSVHEEVRPKGDYASFSVDEVKRIIREAGIVGLGGAAFPTAVKVSPPKEKRIDAYILNGAECEPFLTADHRIMLERPEDVLYGLKVLMYAVGVQNGYICIEDNKPDALREMRKVAANEPSIKVIELKTRYPQGSEKQIIKAVLNREVPPGGLPFDVGVMVSNVGTAAAVADVFKKGLPLVERVVTVTGHALVDQQNFQVKIGTLFSDLIDQVGGYKVEPGKIIMGGPMMGIAQMTAEVPVIKGTSGILVLTRQQADWGEPSPCIKCAKCVDACPVNLLPVFIGGYAEREMYDVAESMNALDCIECGCCAYVCPARRPLTQAIRIAKWEINERRRKCGKK